MSEIIPVALALAHARQVESGWFRGKTADGNIGLFPGNYVKAV